MENRRSRRASLAWIWLLVCCVGLSACASPTTTAAPQTTAATVAPTATVPGTTTQSQTTASTKAQTTAAQTTTTAVQTTAATTTAKPAEPYEFSIFRTAWTQLNDQTDPVIQELNKKFNIKIKIITTPYETWIEKYNIYVTSDQVPDLSVTTGPGTANFNDWAKQKKYIDLYELYQQHCPNIQKYLSKDIVEAHRMDGGKLYGIPKPSLSDTTYAIRQDWLDTLKLQVPQTLDELYTVAKAFKEQDPDGNQKDDTYGLITEDTLSTIDFVFRVFGCNVPPNIAENWIPDPANPGKLTSALLAPGMKKAVAYVAKLFKDGILDQEWMLTKSQAYNDKWMTGKVGVMSTSFQQMISFTESKIKAADPKCVLTNMEGVKGPDGLNVRPMQKGFYMVSSISTKAKDPVKILQFIDFLMTKEGDEMIRYGLEGLTYKREGGKIIWDAEAAKKYGMEAGHPFRQLMQPTIIVVMPETDPRAAGLAEKAKILYQGPFYPASTLTPPSLKEVATRQGADFVKNQVTAIVTTKGDPEAEWDQFIAKWRSEGGDQLITEINELYAANRK